MNAATSDRVFAKSCLTWVDSGVAAESGGAGRGAAAWGNTAAAGGGTAATAVGLPADGWPADGWPMVSGRRGPAFVASSRARSSATTAEIRPRRPATDQRGAGGGCGVSGGAIPLPIAPRISVSALILLSR